MSKTLKLIKSMFLISFLAGCTASTNQIEPSSITSEKKKTITIKKATPRSSSLSDIEARIKADLKSIGKTDQEISNYLIEWRKQNQLLIR